MVRKMNLKIMKQLIARHSLRRLALATFVACLASGQIQTQDAAAQQIMNRPVAYQSPSPQTMSSGDVQIIDLGTNPGCECGRGGSSNGCNYSAQNPPMQPDVAKSRCQPCIRAVDCADNCGGQQTWRDMHAYNFQPLGHAQFQGPVRVPVNREYRIRRGDKITFLFSRSRGTPIDHDYILTVGDVLQIDSTSDDGLKMGDQLQGKGVQIETDGKIYLRVLQKSVRAAGLTIEQLRKVLEQEYSEYLNEPAINIMTIKTNTVVEDLLETIDARQGFSGGRTQLAQVFEDGTVRLIGLGAVCVQGLTLDEVKRELNLRYRDSAPGIYVEATNVETAPHFVYIYGQVVKADRYQLTGPTTVTQALALAGGVTTRGNAREIVIFRRAEDWRYIATRVDLKGMHLGKVPTPADEIEVSDNDLIIVPATPIARFNDFVEQVFQKGAYGIFPLAQVGSGFNASTAIVR